MTNWQLVVSSTSKPSSEVLFFVVLFVKDAAQNHCGMAEKEPA